ncbi:MobC family plasmid mobilization relaxosome protein (plasmid) [Actinobacillus equuli subsp. haemolyticus]|uniref:plasmid mobilization protein n=1 Tax=Actinobacillus equuli TaxID=718 RepID=UPI002418A6D0|nr:plasmid mobilization relaxosome protein MobC [Actinobacillus equuli]MDG4949246.1 MobC family plasmid mobilization relaxosome protein [Actinobacillus equuli subsp. haemolyticus]
MKREKEIKIRLTENEYQALLERKTKARLAEWVREVALEQQPKRQPKVIDPALLFELNRIGVNLNQIARQCNSQSGGCRGRDTRCRACRRRRWS